MNPGKSLFGLRPKPTRPDQTSYRPSTSDVPPSIQPRLPSRLIAKIVLFAALIYFFFPIVWLLISATKSNADLISTFGFAFGENNLAENYRQLLGWTQGLFWRWVGNSLFYATLAGVVGTLISVAAGYALAKFTFPGRGAIQVVVMAGLLLPIALLTIPLYLVFHGIGLTNTIWAIIIPSCVSPFGVFLGNVYARSSVPDEIIESARIDGASEARIFFSIVVRLLAPAMVTIFLFIFVATWNNFLLPLMMINSAELKPVTLGLYGMMSYFNPRYGAVLQGALLGVVPLVIIFLGLQRYWQSGLAAGAVKG